MKPSDATTRNLLLTAGLALCAAVAFAFIGKAHAAPVGRVEFIDAATAAEAEADASSTAPPLIDTITARAQVYPYRCTFTATLAPLQRVQALCFLPLDREVDELTPLPIVQVATGSVWISSHVVGGHYKPRHVRVVLTNGTHTTQPLHATVDVY